MTAAPSPPSTAPGTAPTAPATRSSASPCKNGHATGEYDDFLTGFVTADGQVWGRPVGVAVANDGSLFVTDDGSRSVWHVTYTGKVTRNALPLRT